MKHIAQKLLQQSLLSESFNITNIEKVEDEGSTRQYFRLSVNLQNHSEKFILCQYEKSALLQAQDFIKASQFLNDHHIPCPKVLAISDDGLFQLQTDAGTASLKEYLKNTLHFEIIEDVFRHLLALQKLDIPAFISHKQFHYEKLLFELNFFFEKLSFIPGFESRHIQLQPFFSSLAQRLNQPELFVVTHRDFHSMNIMINHMKQVQFIDIQDLMTGLPYYDLSSFVYDPYMNFSSHEQSRILDLYEHLSGVTIDYSLFHAQALQRVIKALGSYLYLYYKMNKLKYAQFFKPAIDIICRLNELCDKNKDLLTVMDILKETI